MSEITTLQPQLLWKWFDQICTIPHHLIGWRNTTAATFLGNASGQYGLEYGCQGGYVVGAHPTCCL